MFDTCQVAIVAP